MQARVEAARTFQFMSERLFDHEPRKRRARAGVDQAGETPLADDGLVETGQGGEKEQPVALGAGAGVPLAQFRLQCAEGSRLREVSSDVIEPSSEVLPIRAGRRLVAEVRTGLSHLCLERCAVLLGAVAPEHGEAVGE